MEKFLNNELKTFDGVKFEVKKVLSVEEKSKKTELFKVPYIIGRGAPAASNLFLTSAVIGCTAETGHVVYMDSTVPYTYNSPIWDCLQDSLSMIKTLNLAEIAARAGSPFGGNPYLLEMTMVSFALLLMEPSRTSIE